MPFGPSSLLARFSAIWNTRDSARSSRSSLLRLRIVAGVGDLVSHRDHLAHHRALAHDVGVGADVGGARGVFRQLGQVGEAADRIQLAFLLQRFGQGDEVDRLAHLQQTLHLGKDQAMRAAEEVVGDHALRHVVPALVIQHQTAQHRLLGLQRVRRHLQPFHLTISGTLSGFVRVCFVGWFFSCHET